MNGLEKNILIGNGRIFIGHRLVIRVLCLCKGPLALKLVFYLGLQRMLLNMNLHNTSLDCSESQIERIVT